MADPEPVASPPGRRVLVAVVTGAAGERVVYLELRGDRYVPLEQWSVGTRDDHR
jgi:hypothetical protein